MLSWTSGQLVINIDKTQGQRSRSTTVFNGSFFFFPCCINENKQINKQIEGIVSCFYKEREFRIPSKDLMEGGEYKQLF